MSSMSQKLQLRAKSSRKTILFFEKTTESVFEKTTGSSFDATNAADVKHAKSVGITHTFGTTIVYKSR